MKAIPLLMYHSISRDAGSRFRKFTLSPELFDAHLEYLLENRYTPVTVAQLAGMIWDGQDLLPERPVVITFDDGFMDFYESALPALEKYSFPATLFIVTGYVDGCSSWLRPEGEQDRKMLAWSQVLEIDSAGIECGPHSHTHADLDIVPAEVAQKEIVLSKDVLEQKLGHAVTTFCYPYGHYDSRVREMVERAGFQAACAVRNAMSHIHDHRFSLARITVSNQTSVPQLAALLGGQGLHPAEDREAFITKNWRVVRRVRRAWSI
jgi:peptidoglycan/xylan/chitin deacetylase (PgdA/CDA1 family)